MSRAGSHRRLGIRQKSLPVHPTKAAPTSKITSHVAIAQPSMQPKAMEENTKKSARGQKAEMFTPVKDVFVCGTELFAAIKKDTAGKALTNSCFSLYSYNLFHFFRKHPPLKFCNYCTRASQFWQGGS